MEEGTIVRWLRADGDPISPGDELVEIETDKATVVCQAEVAGTLAILVAEGQTHPVGTPLALLVGADAPRAKDTDLDGGSTISSPAEVEGPDSHRQDPFDDARRRAPLTAPSRFGSSGRRPLATPVARRLAMTYGVDLATIHGTGPGERVTKADMLAAHGRVDERLPRAKAQVGVLMPPPITGGEITRVDITRAQRTIARRVTAAKATVPEFTIDVDVDVTRSREFRESLVGQLDKSTLPSFNDLVVKACAAALRRHPRVNGSLSDSGYELYSWINIGIVVAVEGGLLVPVIRDADTLGLMALSSTARELAMSARAGSIAPADLSGGTFTVSNLGGMSVDRFTAVINPPQAAILAVGSIVERPWAVGGRIELQSIMTLRLTCDHRILYGADGAAFLNDVRALLDEPLRMLL